jgi:hypothetical protein
MNGMICIEVSDITFAKVLAVWNNLFFEKCGILFLIVSELHPTTDI